MPAKVQLTRIRELVYEMKAREVMTRSLVLVGEETPMGELREILRTHRISGAPVVSGERLVGVISIEDFIKWLAEGAPKVEVAERMTGDVKTVYDDEPLVLVANKLEQYGFGRLPVLERKKEKLVGVVTKGDIVKGLLRKLEIGLHEDEMQHFGASRSCAEIIGDGARLAMHFPIAGQDFNAAGTGATRMKKVLGQLGLDPLTRRRVAIIAYEAEMNIVIYTDGGELSVRLEPGFIAIEARDNGPGIPDVEQALRPGYSTAAEWVRELGFGAGMGLCNIKQYADEMDLRSAVGEGTTLEARITI